MHNATINKLQAKFGRSMQVVELNRYQVEEPNLEGFFVLQNLNFPSLSANFDWDYTGVRKVFDGINVEPVLLTGQHPSHC